MRHHQGIEVVRVEIDLGASASGEVLAAKDGYVPHLLAAAGSVEGTVTIGSASGENFRQVAPAGGQPLLLPQQQVPWVEGVAGEALTVDTAVSSACDGIFLAYYLPVPA